MKRTQIIAIGGRAFARSNGKPFFEEYILRNTGKKKPRVLFIGTATGDASAYIARFYATFSRLDCKPSHLALFERTPDLRKILLNQDAIFVGGGNTRSMLATWKEWGIPELLHEAWKKGIVMAGTSAGAICWFEQGFTDSWEEDIKVMSCMGFLKGSCCPHYSGEPERKPACKKLFRSGKVKPGIAIDDGAAAHYVNGKLHDIVTTDKKSFAYYLSMRGKKFLEKKITTKVLQ